MMEAKFECLKEVHAKVEANLASKKKKRKAEMVKAKELTKMEKRAMKTFSASIDFMTKKARVVAVF